MLSHLHSPTVSRENTDDSRRAVITGVGPVSVIGNGADDFWARLTSGRKPMVSQVSADCDVPCYRIREELPCPLPPHRLKRLDRAAQLALSSATLALADANLQQPQSEMSHRWGVTFGSALAGFSCAENSHAAYLDKGADAIPLPLATMLVGAAMPGHIAIHFGLTGTISANSDSCAAGNSAVGQALRIIQRGEADVVLAGAAEAPIAPLTASALQRLRVTSDSARCRPFADDRDGFILAEGAGCLVIESLAHATERGADIYGEICGYGATSEAHHMTTPKPGAAPIMRAMTLALNEANIASSDVDLISSHGSATPQNDENELAAIERTFAPHHPPIHAAKSQLGHALGAASALELCAMALTLKTGTELPALYNASGLGSAKDPHIILSNAFGFGGIDTCLALRK